MSLAWRLALLRARARRRRAAAGPDREELVRRHAPGRSFCDVGCMWKVHGRIAFVAEEAGATRVTGIDVMEESEEFRTERERRGSSVRFVRGDLNDARTVEEAGPHEVVFCSGVLYHAPNPILTLQRLRELTRDLLILQTTTIPELPGVSQGAVLYPRNPQAGLYRRLWGPVAERGFRSPEPGEDPYAPWWWGITPSALDAMLRETGFEPEERFGDPFGVHVLARRRS